VDNATSPQSSSVMDRYQLRSKGELSEDSVPASTTVQTYNYAMQMQHMLVLPVTQVGSGPPPEEQSESLLSPELAVL